MTELITGAKGSAHVTSAQQGAINAYTIGPGAYILDGCAATLPSANTLHIAAGHLMVQGRAIEVTATDLTIANGTQWTKRHDLACAHYTLSGGVETTTLSVVQGTASATPVDPTVSGSILAGDATADIPLWRVTLDGITPTVETIALSAIHNELLWSGTSGKTGTLTLSKRATDFSSLRLHYVDSNGVKRIAEIQTSGLWGFSFSIINLGIGSCWHKYVQGTVSGTYLNIIAQRVINNNGSGLADSQIATITAIYGVM